MSYARFTDESDVYVYESSTFTGTAVMVCCGCSLADSTELPTRSAMAWHLIDHELAGDKVPGFLYENLRSGLEHGPGDWVRSSVRPL